MAATDYGNANIHRPGIENAGADARKLFLKLYAGEVLTAFQSKNIMMPLHRVRTIGKGKSASFPMTGKYRDAAYHNPGDEIVPSAARQGERIVSIDDLLLNAQFIPNIDEAMSHYDVRSIYTQEAGFGLGKVADQNILRLAVKAALSENAVLAALTLADQDYQAFDDEDFTQNVVIGDTGTGNTARIADTRSAEKIVQGIMDAKRILDNASVPGDPFVVVSVDTYYDLFKVNGSTMDTSYAIFNRDIGGGGSVASGQVPSILGMPMYVSQHIGSFTTPTGTAWTSSLFPGAADAVSTVTTQASAPDWGSNQPLATAVGSGRTNQYGFSANSPVAGWTTRVKNTHGTPTTEIPANVARRVMGLVMTSDAVATVKLLDLSVESEYQINRQGTLMVAKYAMGHNILRPAASVALIQAL